MSDFEAINTVRRMQAEALPGPFKWGGANVKPGTYARRCAVKTTTPVAQTWTVWQAESEAEPDGLTIAITGNGPHSEAFSALIAHVLSNLDWLLDIAVDGALARERAALETK